MDGTLPRHPSPMNGFKSLSTLGLALLAIAGSPATAQNQYIGYVYPAGGQQGSTVPIRLGGQNLLHASEVIVTGEGVSVRLVDHYRVMNNEEIRLLREQVKALKAKGATVGDTMAAKMAYFELPEAIGPQTEPLNEEIVGKDEKELARQRLIKRIEMRFAQDERQPAVRSHAELVFAEVTVSPHAKPGLREIRVISKRGISNALPFFVGQVPEVSRKAVKTSKNQVLGKEHLAQRKRPPEEAELRVTLPCTMNGQVAPGEVNRYRFQVKKGQRLVITAKARVLVPYVADGVPGWFQAVLRLHDANGNEVAYNDDFFFHPDPVMHFEVPADGEYVLSINEALYRGRESFTYRITVGELPFVTSIFPLGGRAGQPVKIEMDGFNLDKATLTAPPTDARPGRHLLAATSGNLVSNHIPFALDTLPECLDTEPNNAPATAQKVTLPVIVNGRADQAGDWDVFEVNGKAGQTIVAEVQARRLDSPFDSFVKVTTADRKIIALNDDHHDAASGLNTDHADSYLMAKLPADGKYFVHIGDTRRHAGKAYAYRLRISHPQPDFALRAMPSRLVIRSKKTATLKVFAIRKDGFTGPIKLAIEDLPKGLESSGATIPEGKQVVNLTVKTGLTAMDKPVNLTVVGTAKAGDREIVREAVPAEDRMQAFLWRHLLTSETLPALVCNPSYNPPPKRIRPPIPDAFIPKEPKHDLARKSVDRYRRQIEILYQEWLITDDFANRKVAYIESRLMK